MIERLDAGTRRFFVWVAVTLMAVAAAYRLPVELGRLVFEPPGRGAAMDLLFRYAEVHAWFAGQPAYGVIESADYPPASYLLLFPWVHWPTPETTCLVWALLSIGLTAWLSMLCVRVSGATSLAGRAFAALLPLSMYATAATLRLGQMGLLLLPLLLVGSIAIATRTRSLRRDLGGVALLTIALVKPTIAPPFMWLAFFRGGWRVTALIVGAYAALTLAAASFQDASLAELVRGWLGQRDNIDFARTQGNLYAWLAMAGWDRHLAEASLVVLVLLGGWTWRHRAADPWKLLAVAAITARVWSYHHHYDDVLLLFPLLALLRDVNAASAAGRDDRPALGALLLVWGIGILPASLFAAGVPGRDLLQAAKTAVWLGTLVLIARRARNPAVAPTTR
jgi:hypothetical protein